MSGLKLAQILGQPCNFHAQVTRHYIGYHGARPDIPGGASLDEGLLSLSLSNLLYMENPYSYQKCQ